MKNENVKDFILNDFPKTLFPLDTTRVLVEHCSNELATFVYEKILNPGSEDYAFLPQTKAYASKSGQHLRRTLQLDPVAHFYIYDLVCRNRALFRKDFQESRANFGYRFENGDPISATVAYHEFKNAVKLANTQYRFCLKFDIASYFNSIYHHDLVNWASTVNFSDTDCSSFDKFLKQINSGRSIDCLPQGLYPSKMIGAHFLKFIDNSPRIKSEQLFRFMDDFVLFSNDLRKITADFQTIQIMLGEKGLSVNSGKTHIGGVSTWDFEEEIDTIKEGLLLKRLEFITGFSDEESYEELEEPRPLDDSEEEYLLSLLGSDNLEEEDAELALKLMRDNSEKLLQYLEDILTRFPNLSKSVYYFCASLERPEDLAEICLDIVKSDQKLSESQLFWIAKIAESYLSKTREYGDILIKCLEHPDATDISKSKILEIKDKRYGLTDIRESNLRTGSSNWISWSSAIGMLAEKKAVRNHLLGYFANASPLNRVIRDCLEKM